MAEKKTRILFSNTLPPEISRTWLFYGAELNYITCFVVAGALGVGLSLFQQLFQ